MSKIRLLDDDLANKIAAGEVVERPASVVKELLENSIDANSTVIEIFIEAAGLKSIRIVDNGDGIASDDVKRAFLRHATSKIKDETDLFRIRTLGFRGEALPSIASVSHMTLETSTGDGAGRRLILEGGKIITDEGSPARKGTDITVSQIFYNTPARLKYLRSEATELGNISDIVNRLAFSYPNISFKLMSNGKLLLKTVGNGNLSQVFASVYGLETAKKMKSFNASSLDFQIDGLLSAPEITRASRNYMTILINGRYVKNFLISKAIIDAYHTLLPINRYPFVLLNVKMDPYLVDVNVHPTKMEVRLSKEQELMALVTGTIREELLRDTHIPSMAVAPVLIQKVEQEEPVQQSLSLHKMKIDKVNKTCGQKEGVLGYKPSKEAIDIYNKQLEEQAPVMTVKEEVAVYPVGEKEQAIPRLYAIGQMHGTYILAQNENGLYLVDQHAAQERMKYEHYKVEIGRVEQTLQDLLLPITLEYAVDQVIKIKEVREELQAVGIHLEEFGGNSFIVRTIPTWFPSGQEEAIIEGLIEQILSSRKLDIAKLRENIAIMMSCKASIKANQHLRQDEMQALLDDLVAANNPLTCPHGRPVMIHYSVRELEKMFKRVM